MSLRGDKDKDTEKRKSTGGFISLVPSELSQNFVVHLCSSTEVPPGTTTVISKRTASKLEKASLCISLSTLA